MRVKVNFDPGLTLISVILVIALMQAMHFAPTFTFQ